MEPQYSGLRLEASMGRPLAAKAVAPFAIRYSLFALRFSPEGELRFLDTQSQSFFANDPMAAFVAPRTPRSFCRNAVSICRTLTKSLRRSACSDGLSNAKSLASRK